ncbi:ATP-binding protein [candidate division KSB1 bacterium]|nr:ATP-binding protein [candidate division KSB1 bacterium]
MIKPRNITPYILQDLQEKMVFIGGARQVGKTTLARELIAPHFQNLAYFNWDNRQHRQQLMKGEMIADADMVIFDEIHKYKKWKSLVKGLYDSYSDKYKFLITGNARLNIYRKGDDSLLGRYHYFTLNPFTLAEILKKNNELNIFNELPIENSDHFDDLNSLEQFGGFPEMVVKQDARALRRWHQERNERLFREDIRDLDVVRDIANIQLLGDFLPDRVGSLLSANSLREDLEVSYRAISHWLDILEQFYYHFRIYPFHERRVRSIKKEPKLYLHDWSQVKNPAARYENIIACHLNKLVVFLNEYHGYKAALFFLRNVAKKEVDFLVTVNNKPWFCVEAKLSDTRLASELVYFRDRLEIPFCYQVVRIRNHDVVTDNVRIVSADRFLAALI